MVVVFVISFLIVVLGGWMFYIGLKRLFQPRTFREKAQVMVTGLFLLGGFFGTINSAWLFAEGHVDGPQLIITILVLLAADVSLYQMMSVDR